MSALNIGRSGLAVNQAAVQTAGNNLANSATEGFTRQSAVRSAAGGVEISPGVFAGNGVRLQSIIRNVDEALNARLRTATSDQDGAKVRSELLNQIETIHNELNDSGLSSRLNEFFNAASELANNPADSSVRTLLIQQGSTLAEFIQQVRSDLDGARGQLDQRIRNATGEVNDLIERIADLNIEIAQAEGGSGGDSSGANALRDQRDQLIGDLSGLVDLTTNDQPGGGKNVLINGIPVVQGGKTRPIEADFQPDGDGNPQVRMRLKEDGTFITVSSGELGQMVKARSEDMQPALDALDEFSAALIFQVNRVHSQGQGIDRFGEMTGAYAADDPSAAMSSADAGLDFTPKHGSFQIHVTQESTGSRTSRQIDVDLDGLNGADMSLDDLAAAIDAVDNISATVDAGGRLNITSDSDDFTFSFSDDTSGVLAATGMNAFFTGADAAEIGVSQRLVDNPRELAATRDHVKGGNANALALADLQDQSLDDLGGISISQMWSDHIADYAVRTSQADLTVESTASVVESLQAQRDAVSGVSVDEESINLLAFQRAYQGSARFLTTIDEMLNAVLAMAR